MKAVSARRRRRTGSARSGRCLPRARIRCGPWGARRVRQQGRAHHSASARKAALFPTGPNPPGLVSPCPPPPSARPGCRWCRRPPARRIRHGPLARQRGDDADHREAAPGRGDDAHVAAHLAGHVVGQSLVELRAGHHHEVEPAAHRRLIRHRVEGAASAVHRHRQHQRAGLGRDPHRPVVEIVGADPDRDRRIGIGQPSAAGGGRSLLQPMDAQGMVEGFARPGAGESVALRENAGSPAPWRYARSPRSRGRRWWREGRRSGSCARIPCAGSPADCPGRGSRRSPPPACRRGAARAGSARSGAAASAANCRLHLGTEQDGEAAIRLAQDLGGGEAGPHRLAARLGGAAAGHRQRPGPGGGRHAGEAIAAPGVEGPAVIVAGRRQQHALAHRERDVAAPGVDGAGIGVGIRGSPPSATPSSFRCPSRRRGSRRWWRNRRWRGRGGAQHQGVDEEPDPRGTGGRPLRQPAQTRVSCRRTEPPAMEPMSLEDAMRPASGASRSRRRRGRPRQRRWSDARRPHPLRAHGAGPARIGFARLGLAGFALGGGAAGLDVVRNRPLRLDSTSKERRESRRRCWPRRRCRPEPGPPVAHPCVR